MTKTAKLYKMVAEDVVVTDMDSDYYRRYMISHQNVHRVQNTDELMLTEYEIVDLPIMKLQWVDHYGVRNEEYIVYDKSVYDFLGLSVDSEINYRECNRVKMLAEEHADYCKGRLEEEKKKVKMLENMSAVDHFKKGFRKLINRSKV